MVYEGISIICFNCGVYGHVKVISSYISEDATETPNQMILKLLILLRMVWPLWLMDLLLTLVCNNMRKFM